MPKSKIRKKKTDSQLFLSERVLANAPIAVQELLQSAMEKLNHSQILQLVHAKNPYMKISDAKKKKKKYLGFRTLYSSSFGPARRLKKGYEPRNPA